MPDLSLRSSEGGHVVVGSSDVDRLSARLHGTLLEPTSAGYDAARSIWNGMIDRRPGLIVRCASRSDVAGAVDFARDHGLLTSIRGGGHNIAGNAVCDEGLMIDLSLMNGVRVDPEARTATVGPGATLGDFDREAQAFGLATPLGINSTTGVAGLTLGGGFGWLTRKHGMTVDNLRSAEVVTADGRVRRASEDEDADLFWGLRGGGGNFGVVTSFEYDLHPVGPDVLSGLVVYPFEDAGRILRGYREAAERAPDELSAWLVLRKAPPLPFLPEEVHGREIVVVALVWAGDPDDGERHVQPFRELGTPHGSHVDVQPYAGFQTAFDPLLTPGARNYWKSHDFRELSDGLFDTLVDWAGRLPSPHTEIFVGQLGGAAQRVDPTATAYPHRDVSYIMNVHGRWESPEEDEGCVGWCRDFFQATAPYATGGVYVNFMTEDEAARVRSAYGSNYDRLLDVKRAYDPDNLFRMNHNIRPS